jgi:hypothetical protein
LKSKRISILTGAELDALLHWGARRIVPVAKYLLILALALHAAPAAAGSVVATPALYPPIGGGLRCLISNASDKKPITVEWALYKYDGTVAWGPIVSLLEPLENTMAGGLITAQSACIAKVVKGGKKSLRLSLYAEDSTGGIVAAVSGW